VLRVRRTGPQDTVQEYSVQTRLFSPTYTSVFTEEDNSNLVATDTQKNTVYYVAKTSGAKTPEDFGVDLARHFIKEYPMLSAVEVEVTEDLWQRITQADGPHSHGFVRQSPEKASARVRITRSRQDTPEVVSGITGLTVLKTTQSGFSDYLQDKYTLLGETTERCLATEMKLEWTYTAGAKPVDYEGVRKAVHEQMFKGFFGPAESGVYSVSLQATIYDAGCLVLAAAPRVARLSIYTPNIHMIPFHNLKSLGSQFDDDVYVATSDPAGTIHCTVSRS